MRQGNAYYHRVNMAPPVPKSSTIVYLINRDVFNIITALLCVITHFIYNNISTTDLTMYKNTIYCI